jgi:hypothetical protein
LSEAKGYAQHDKSSICDRAKYICYYLLVRVKMPYPALPPEPPALTLPEAASCATPSLPEEGALTTAPRQSELDTRLTKTQSASESVPPMPESAKLVKSISDENRLLLTEEGVREERATLTSSNKPNSPLPPEVSTSGCPHPQLPLKARTTIGGIENVEPSATLAAPANSSPLSTQLTAQALDSAGSAPSLRPTPSTPGQKPFLPQNTPLPQTYLTAPSITVVTPSAYGKSEGRAAVGFSLQAPSDESSKDVEGRVGISFGLGDSRQAVGLDVAASASVTKEQFAERVALSAKLHRQLPNDFAISVGVRSITNLNSLDEDEDEISLYAVMTKQFRLRPSQIDPFSRLYISVGVGGGQFREQSDREDEANSIGVFGSMAVRVAQPLNAIAEWTGQDLILGLSWTPIPRIPLVITPAFDATGNVAGGKRFLLGIGYGFSL